MRRSGSIRGFSVGVVVGILVASAGMAVAAFGYKGWQRVSEDFRNGYVQGFIEMANLARNLDPGGWVDTKYPYVPKAKFIEWRVRADELYAKPENQKYAIDSLLQLVARDLEGRYGTVRAEERQRSIMAMQLKQLYERQVEEAKAKGLPPPPAPAELPKDFVPHKTIAKPDKKRTKKWCRCDGSDVAAVEKNGATPDGAKPDGAKPADEKTAVEKNNGPDAAKAPGAAPAPAEKKD